MRFQAVLFLMIVAAVPGPAAASESAGDGPWLRGEALEVLKGMPILDIHVEGNLRTDDFVILRELSLYPGELFDPEALRHDLRFLQGLGLFLSSDARACDAQGEVRLVIELEERSWMSMRYVYPMLDIDERMRLRAGLAFRNRNLRGKRDDLRLSGTLGWENRVQFSLERPWLGSYPLEHHLSCVFRELDADGVEQFREQAFNFQLYLPLDRRRPREQRFIFGTSLAWRRQEEDGEIFDERLPGLILGYSHDGRDSFIHPRMGERFDLILLIYSPNWGSSHSLRRWLLTTSRYQSIGRLGVLAGRLRLGIQEGELFHRVVWSLGGLTRVRGWAPGHFSGWDGHEGFYGPQGRNRAVCQLEWRRKLFSQRRWQLTRWWVLDFEGEILLFLDGGKLWRNGVPWEDGIPGDEAFGFGIGLRIFSPLGDVLRLELGINPEGGWQIHAGNALPF